MKTPPQPIPPEIREAVMRAECARMELAPDEHPSIEFGAYFPEYATDNPAYSGPVVVVIWASDPGDHSTFIVQDGCWVHCRSS